MLFFSLIAEETSKEIIPPDSLPPPTATDTQSAEEILTADETIATTPVAGGMTMVDIQKGFQVIS